MGGGSYSTNNRVNAAAAAAAARREEEVASLASPFDAGSDPFAVEQTPERFTYQTGDVLPEGYRSPAKFFSDMTSDEQRASRELARLVETGQRAPTFASTSGLSVQDFGAQPKFGSPDEALANYGNVFNTLKGQEERVNKVYNYNNFDPGDFGRSSVSLREGNRAAGAGLAEYVQQNDIPLSKVIDGERKYLTTGNAQANQELWPNAFQGGDLVATGPVGTYSTTFQKDKNLLAQVASDPILGIAANFIPGGTLALTAAKAASGESLSPTDIVTLAVPALTKAGMLTAPQAAVSAADAVDGVAKVAVEGAGIAGLGYNNSVALINAAATGDPTSVVTSLVGNTVIDKAFLGIEDGERLAGLFQADDLKTGLTKVVEKVASGEKFDDALLAGLGTYVKEGGTLRLPTPEGFDLDIDLGIIEDVVKAAVRPIEDIVREAGKVIDDNVLQPAGNALSALDTAIRQALPDINGPNIDLPDLNLPDINLPNFNLPSFTLGNMGMMTPQPAPNRTTDSLFKDELFQFQTEIGADVEPIEYVDLGFSDPFQEQTLTQRYPF